MELSDNLNESQGYNLNSSVRKKPCIVESTIARGNP